VVRELGFYVDSCVTVLKDINWHLVSSQQVTAEWMKCENTHFQSSTGDMKGG
jgi:uncharacterized protein (DUF2237 family)